MAAAPTQIDTPHERRGRLVPLLREARRAAAHRLRRHLRGHDPVRASSTRAWTRACTSSRATASAPSSRRFYAGHPTWEDDPRVLARPPPHAGRAARARHRGAAARSSASEIFAPDAAARSPAVGHHARSTASRATARRIVSRVHHCLVDGVSGIELLLAVLDLVAEPGADATTRRSRGSRSRCRDPHRVVGRRHVRAVEQRTCAPSTEWQQNLLDPRGADALDDRLRPRACRSLLADPAAADAHAVEQPDRRQAPRRRGPSMSFQEVRGIRSALGGTVNDVMLTILGGAPRPLPARRTASTPTA